MALLSKPMIACPSVVPTIVDAATNQEHAKMVMEEWKLGPETPSEKPGENADYWKSMAVAWQTSEDEARRQKCSNCEYYNNTVEMIEAMDAIPFNSLDEGAGGRGYCHKFEFICHDLRSCMAWEAKDYFMEVEMNGQA